MEGCAGGEVSKYVKRIRDPNCRCGRPKLEGGSHCDHCMREMQQKSTYLRHQKASVMLSGHRTKPRVCDRKDTAARLLAAEAKLKGEVE